MSKPGEHKTVQPPSPSELRRSGARILAYAEAEGALLGRFPPSLFSFSGTGRHFSPDIYGNRECVEHLRNRGKFFDHEEKRERDLSQSVPPMRRGATPLVILNWHNSKNCAINAPHKAS